ncbi:MAG: hypothetical protein ACK4M7_09665, partial [Burkholderiales bacterium]
VNDYSIIIACCSSDKPLLDADILQQIINQGQRLLIIDLSMPLITSLRLRKFPNITVLTIDDIAKIVDVGVTKRKIAAIEANNLINDKLIEYQSWLKKRGLTPLIKALRDGADTIRMEALAVAQKQLLNGESPDMVLHNLSIKLTNKLLHSPTVNLCNTSGELQDDLASLVSYLYDLETNTDNLSPCVSL